MGNVLATVQDRKSGYGNVGGLYAKFNANVSSLTDYYPGGFLIKERTKASISYRFGNQEQESDNEIYGDKIAYAYKYRFEGSRLNRFWSVDPLAKEYPHNSSYAFSENRLIDGRELEGLEWQPVNATGENTGQYSKDKIDYKWTGYNMDGTAPVGTVATGRITWKDQEWNYTSHFDPTTKSGTGMITMNSTDQSKRNSIFIYSDNSASHGGEMLQSPSLGSGQYHHTNVMGMSGFQMNSHQTTSFGGVRSWSQLEGIKENSEELAMMFMPLPKGLQLFGRGTSLLGAVGKSSLGMLKAGGAAGELNFYTKLAYDIGFKGGVERTTAGLFVQINHNIPRILSGKGWATLRSSSATTVMGRTWQNQAIGLGLVNLSISGYGLHKTVKN